MRPQSAASSAGLSAFTPAVKVPSRGPVQAVGTRCLSWSTVHRTAHLLGNTDASHDSAWATSVAATAGRATRRAAAGTGRQCGQHAACNSVGQRRGGSSYSTPVQHMLGGGLRRVHRSPRIALPGRNAPQVPALGGAAGRCKRCDVMPGPAMPRSGSRCRPRSSLGIVSAEAAGAARPAPRGRAGTPEGVVAQVLPKVGHREVDFSVARGLDQFRCDEAKPVLAGVVGVDLQTGSDVTHPRWTLVLGHRKEEGSIDARQVGESRFVD